MRFSTWNISHGGSSRIADICGQVAQLEPDVLVLTEFQTYNEIPLRERLGDIGYRFIMTSNPDPKRNGLLLASRMRVEVVASTRSDTDGERWLAVEIGDLELDVLAVHIPGSDDNRFRDGVGISGRRRKEVMWERVVEYARTHRERRAMILGDFNTGLPVDAEGTPFTLSRYITTLNEIGFVDTWRHLNPDTRDFTWFSKRKDKATGIAQDLNGFRLDYVFVSAALRQSIVDARIVHEPRRVGMSDHAIVIADLDMGATPPTAPEQPARAEREVPDNAPAEVARSGSLDVFQRADVRIDVRNSPTGLLMSAEIATPARVVTLRSGDSNRWEKVASWLRGTPETEPADVKYTARQKREVRQWAGDPALAGGDLYRAGLKMLAEEFGWTVSSARLPPSSR